MTDVVLDAFFSTGECVDQSTEIEVADADDNRSAVSQDDDL